MQAIPARLHNRPSSSTLLKIRTPTATRGAAKRDPSPCGGSLSKKITRFRTLRGFFNKIPEGLETAPSETAPSFEPPSTVLHKYSHANQQVNNWGGNGYLNLWQPAINTSKGEGFSLTQHWYVGGSGTSLPGLQTVEIGWQVYPSLYGDTKPHFFIYHTADGYNHTGCYNLTCSDFVQTSSSIHIGSSIGPVSVSGGSQYEIQIQVQFYQGNWWLRYGGTAFGYYPKALFHGGQLTKNATVVDYGTETTGTNDWPPRQRRLLQQGMAESCLYPRSLLPQ